MFNWNRGTASGLPSYKPNTFSLPAPLPQWPQGRGFSTGRINLGDIEVVEVTKFELVWGCRGVSFYKPVNIPDGFCCLGYYCQLNCKPLQGFVLAVRNSLNTKQQNLSGLDHQPALLKPLDYTLLWSSEDGNQEALHEQPGYFWAPQPPEGYRSLGFVVTNKPTKPDLEEVRCIRLDLTAKCETCNLMLETRSKFLKVPFRVWRTRPHQRGLEGRGVAVGSFYCNTLVHNIEKNPELVCLKNFDLSMHSMPNLDQIRALISHYGPTLFFHPKEKYFPSSVSWFFESGALLYKKGEENGLPIDSVGSNLPGGGKNDGEFWLDLPGDKETVKYGDLKSSELYAHVKPAIGGTHTDIAMWVFCPFNGPATLKLGPMSLSLGKIGQHLGDWEHFTLRISNFTGELRSIYFSQHSGGVWVDACDLEYIKGNRAIVYSSRYGHASYPHPGTYLQGSTKLGVGIRNDCSKCEYFMDSSRRYQIVAAEYLREEENVGEPQWLQFMREWGPTVVYNSRVRLDKVLKILPLTFRNPVANFFKKLPLELFGEEGPTGPKEKNNWVGDERW